MEMISKEDALAIVRYAKDPIEGIMNLPTIIVEDADHG